MKQDRYSAILRTMLFLTWTFLFATFALNIFGISTYKPIIYNPNLLQLIDTVNNNIYFRIIFNIVIGFISINIMFACLIKNYFKSSKLLILLIFLYLVISNIFYFYNVKNIFTYAVPMLMYFLPALKKIKLLDCFLILIYDNLYMMFSLFIMKISILNNHYDFEPYLIAIINTMLIWTLTFIDLKKKGVLLCGYLERGLAYLQRLSKKLKGYLQKETPSLTSVEQKKTTSKQILWQLKRNLQSIKLFLQIKLPDVIIESIPVIAISCIYLGYALFINKHLEAIFLYVAYIKLYKLFPKNFHADFIPGIKPHLIEITCTCLTSLVLCTALFLTIGGGVSVISTIVVAFIVNWFSYVVADHFDYQLELPFTNKLKEMYETDYTKYGLTKRTANFAYDWKVNGLSEKELMIKYELNTKSTLDSKKKLVKDKIKAYKQQNNAKTTLT